MTVASAREHVGVGAAPTESFCALVIDDHPGDASAVRTALSSSPAADFAVLRAPNLDAGVDALRLDDIDVVLVRDDLLATDAITVVLEAAAGRPVLALTRSTDPTVATRLIDAGLHDAISSGASAADALAWATVRSIHRANTTSDPTEVDGARPAPAPGPSATGTAAAIRRQIAEARTPLAALVDLLDLLTSAWDALAEENKLSMLSSIRSYASMVDQLTGNLDTTASTTADHLAPSARPAPPAPRPVGLAQAVSRAVSLTGLDITTDIDPNLVVWVDPRDLDQMLTALLTRVAHRSIPPVRATASRGGTSVRLSIHGAGATHGEAVKARSVGGWSLLQPNPTSGGEVSDLDVELDDSRRLAESNGGLAGIGDQRGSAWLRLPSTPPDPALA